MLVLVVALARAGESELEVERGRVALELEQNAEARAQAELALERAPDLAVAVALHNEALVAAGLASRGLVEVPASESAAAQAELAARIEGGAHWKGVRDLAYSTSLRFTDDPEVLLPLWSSTDNHLVKARGKLWATWTERDALASASTELLYRLRKIAIEARDDEDRASLEAALIARGEPAPPARPLLDRLERGELALTLSRQVTPEPVWLYPSEVVEVGDKLGTLWQLGGRHADLARAWTLLQEHTDSAVPSVRASASWLEAGDPTAASAAIAAGLERAGGPKDVDLAAANVDRLSAELGLALRTRAMLRERSGDVTGARGDAGTAILLEGRVVDSRLTERIDERARPLERTLTYVAPRGGTTSEGALTAATKASTPEERLAVISDARFLAFVGMDQGSAAERVPAVWAGAAARTWLAEAEARRDVGELAAARTCAVVATVLSGPTAKDAWATRGLLHEALGERAAAFSALALARALGSEGLDDALARSFDGAGPWEVVAARLTEGIEPEGAVAAVAPVATGARPRPVAVAAPVVTPPSVGAPFPEYTHESAAGTLSLSAQRGRVLVLTFLTADCDACLQMLPTFGKLVRNLRASGTDAALIAFSLDEDQEEFQRAQLIGRGGGALVWAPELRERFGIGRLPTTWLVDRNGTARYVVDRWLSAGELEDLVSDLD